MKEFPIARRCVVATVLLVAMTTSQAQFAEVTAGVAANQVISSLDGVINDAREAGDYLAVRAAMEAKGVIEAWKDANSELLDTAFDQLDQKQRNVFNNARQLAEQANNDIDARLKNAESIANQVNQLMVEIPGQKTSYVTQFYPRVIPSQATSSITLKVKGVNLDSADPVMSVNATPAARMIIGPMEVHYTVPIQQLQREPDKLNIVPLTLSYTKPKEGFWNRLMGKREPVQRQLPLVMLPTNVGRYQFSSVAVVTKKEVDTFTSQSQKFRGKNEDKEAVALPPEGWQWDWAQGVAAFEQKGDGGEAGKCNGVLANKSGKNGITHRAHLDSIRRVDFPRVTWGPGHQNCKVTGPIFRMVQVEVQAPPVTGTLAWTDDLRLALPDGLKSMELNVTTFDGRKRVLTGAGEDKLFNVVQGPSEIIVRPKQPADI